MPSSCSPASPPWWTCRARSKGGSIALAGAVFGCTSARSSPTPCGSSRIGTSSSSNGTKRAAGATSRNPSGSWIAREQHPSGRLRGIVYPGPDRDLHGIDPARRSRPCARHRAPAHHPPLAVEARIPRDRAPSRQDTARIRRRHRFSRPRYHPRARHLHRRAPGHPLALHRRPRAARRLRRRRRPLPIAVRPLRARDGTFRALPGARDQPGDGNRRRPPQPRGGDAARHHPCSRDGRQHQRGGHRRDLPGPRRWAEPRPSGATISDGSCRGRRRTSCSSISITRRCGRCETRSGRSYSKRRTGRCARSSSTGKRWSQKGSPCISIRKEPPPNSRNPRHECWPKRPNATSSEEARKRSRRTRCLSERSAQRREPSARAVLFTPEPAPGPRPRVRSLGAALHGMPCRGGDPVPRRWRPRAAPARMG